MGILDAPGITKARADATYLNAGAYAKKMHRYQLALTGLAHGIPIATESIWYDGTASNGVVTNGNSRKRHAAYFDGSGVRAHFANIVGRDQVVNVTSIIVRAACELADGTVIPYYFGGKRDITLDPGAVVCSDPLNADITAGQFFYTRTLVTVAPGNLLITITGTPTGGTFTITVNGLSTSALAYNSTTTVVAAALQALIPQGGGYVTVTGTAASSYKLRFTANPGVVTVANALTGGTTPTATLTINGAWPLMGGSPNTHANTVSAWGEGCDATNGTVRTDQTLSGTIGPNSVAQFSPFLITGIPAADSIPNWVGLAGDSIESGLGDVTAPLDVGRGFVRRALAGAVPYASIAASGEFASEKDDLRRGYLRGATSVITDIGVNDLTSSQTLASIQANMIRRWVNYGKQGARVYQTTITPKSTSTDGWATTTNQTPDTTVHPKRIPLNAWLRDGAPMLAGTAVATGSSAGGTVRIGAAGHPVTGLFEVSDLVESARDSGIWAPAYVYTIDAQGIHPNDAGHAVMATAVNVAALIAD